ncbi:hypothetical protein, partial [Enterobacter asburiae]
TNTDFEDIEYANHDASIAFSQSGRSGASAHRAGVNKNNVITEFKIAQNSKKPKINKNNLGPTPRYLRPPRPLSLINNITWRRLFQGVYIGGRRFI